MNPCHLIFPRIHISESPYTANRSSGFWLSTLLLEIFDIAAGAPWPVGCEHSQAQNLLEVPPQNRDACLHLYSVFSPCN
jgi:hypothetical protein